MNITLKKTLNILKIIGNVIFYSIIAFLLIFSISSLSASKSELPPQFLGWTYLSVQSDSMEGENDDSFFKGDLIFIKQVSDAEAYELEVGDIITFFDQNLKDFNTHRIITIIDFENGSRGFETQGDNTRRADDALVNSKDVVGVYTSKWTGAGVTYDYLSSPGGFAVIIVLPTFVFLAWQIIVLVRALLKSKEDKIRLSVADEKEQLRKELLEQLRKEQEDKVQ